MVGDPLAPPREMKPTYTQQLVGNILIRGFHGTYKSKAP